MLFSVESWFQQVMSGGQPFLLGAMALLAGFLTSLSPCVYPLIPITLGVLSRRPYGSRWAGFWTSAFYVLGMTLLYSVLGISFSLLGLLSGALFQNFYFIIGIAICLFIFAAHLLVDIKWQLPQSFMKKLSVVGGNGFRGAFLMGLCSGLIAAPCTGPVLAFILALLAHKGDLIQGAVLMMLFSFGLGIPFLILGTFASTLSRLPKSGPWMRTVRVLLGIGMLCSAFYYLMLAMPQLRSNPAAYSSDLQNEKWHWQLINENDVSINRFEQILLDSKSSHIPVLIDFFAEWCVACKQMEHETYSNTRVQDQLMHFVAIKIDVTSDTTALRRLQKRYGVVGLPAVIFLDSNSKEIKDKRLFGFVKPKAFVELLRSITDPSKASLEHKALGS